MRRIVMVLAPVLAFGALGAWAAAGPSTESWPSCPQVVIGIAQPETDGTAVGWDVTPAQGGWGGRGANGSFAVAWENDQPDAPALLGRFAEVTVPGTVLYVPTKVEIGYLAGIANDDYCILIQQARCGGPSAPLAFVAIDCLNDDESNTTETWTTAEFPLPRFLFGPGQDMTIQIRVTGNAWSGKPTWGQLAVDYVKVWGVPKTCW